jgi:transposase
MARKLEIAWQDDAEQLFHLYRDEVEPELRTRFHALWLIRQGQTPTAAAQLVGVQLRTVRTWLRWYREGGTTTIRQHRQGGRQGKPALLTAEQCDELKAHTASGAVKTIDQAREWVETHFGVRYTYWGMRSLFERLRIGKKVPRPQADKAKPAEQEAWKKGGSPARCEQQA